MTIAQGTVGPTPASVGTTPAGGFQQGHDSELVTADFHGRYYTAAYNGRLYMASSGSVAPGTALATTAQALLLFNPAGSGVNLEVVKCSVGLISATAYGAGYYVYAGVASAIPTGTKLAVSNGLVGNAATGVGQAWTGATPTAPVQLRASGLSLLPFTGSSVLTPPPLIEELAGEFVVIPGTVFAFTFIGGAGTAPLANHSISWIESKI